MLKKGHDRLKYGDIVNIEFSDETELELKSSKDNKKKQYKISAVGFSFDQIGKIDFAMSSTTSEKTSESEYEKKKNLFIIFPPMNDEFLTNSSSLEQKIGTFSAKIDQQIYNDSNKDDLNKIIMAYNETKKDINNSDFLEIIGQSIKFNNKFILIHYQSQTVLSVREKQNAFDNRLALSDHYNENCIFVFDAYNKYDNSADEVFSGQSIYIRKSEKHAWANNPYLQQNNISKQMVSNALDEEYSQKKNLTTLLNKNLLTAEDEEEEKLKKLKKKIFAGQKSRKEPDRSVSFQRIHLTDDKEKATSFKVKVCSSYIDPISTNLSFTNTIWIVCLSQEKYLLVKENNKSELSANSQNNPIENVITYEKIEGDKQIHNIYGLFDVEQMETHEVYNLSEKIDSSFIHYNRIVRLRNVATKQYLGFDDFYSYDQKEQLIFDDGLEEDFFNRFSKKVLNLNKQKKVGKLVLLDEPTDICEWTFMESYIILNRELYEKSKLEGITAKKKNNDQEIAENFVKKKDILRIFHCKSGKFLSFEDIDKNVNDRYSFITLSKQPVDNDLFQLSPSNESQAYEIYLILFFSENFNKLIREVISQELRTFLNNAKNKPTVTATPLTLNVPNVPSSIPKAPGIGDNKGRKRGDTTISFLDRPVLTNDLQTIKEDPNDVIAYKRTSVNKDQLEREEKERKEEVEKDEQRREKQDRLDKIIHFTQSWTDLRHCFEDISEFCINKYSKRYDPTNPIGKPVHNRQEFLREQKFLEITLNFLELGVNSFVRAEKKFEEERHKSSFTIDQKIRPDDEVKVMNYDKDEEDKIAFLFVELDKCIKKSFEFIFSLCRRNIDNRKYVFENRHKFAEYLLKYQEAAKCLIDIIKDDENYMAKIIQENKAVKKKSVKTTFKWGDLISSKKDMLKISNDPQNTNSNLIDNIFNFLNKSMTEDRIYDIHTFSLLSKLMHSKDKGITSNQSFILNKIINESNEFLLKIEPNFKDIGFWVVYKTENTKHFDPSEHIICKSLVDLCINKSFIPESEKRIIEYLGIQLNLFADMCYGRNYVAIEKVREIFPLDNLIYVISIIDLNESKLLIIFLYYFINTLKN